MSRRPFRPNFPALAAPPRVWRRALLGATVALGVALGAASAAGAAASDAGVATSGTTTSGVAAAVVAEAVAIDAAPLPAANGDGDGTHPGRGNGGQDNGKDGKDSGTTTGGGTGGGTGGADPATEPTVAPSAGVTDTGNPVEDAANGSTAQHGTGFGDPTTFGTSLKTSDDIHLTESSLAVTGTLAAAFVFMFAFPAEFLRVILARNYARIAGWIAAARRRAREATGRPLAGVTWWGRARNRATDARAALVRRFPALSLDWVQVLLAAVGAAVILSFADPHVGFHANTLRLLLAIFISTVLVTVTVNAVVRWVAEHVFSTEARFNPMPYALLFMVAAVFASRIAGIHPGFIIGLVMGVTLSRHLKEDEEAKLALTGVTAFFGIGLVSWFLYGLVPHGEHGTAAQHLLSEALTTATLEGFCAAIVGLLPLAFLEGRPIFEWSRQLWAIVTFVVVVTFIMLIVPMSGDFHETKGDFGVLMLGFVIFSILVIGLWYLFKVLDDRDARIAAAARAGAAKAGAARASAAKAGAAKAGTPRASGATAGTGARSGAGAKAGAAPRTPTSSTRSGTKRT